MKLTKRKVFVVALAICLIAIVSMGTLAWFNANDEVTNNFLIADSTDDTPDKIFSVDVWEDTPEGPKDQDGAEYADILPGSLLDKEAHVENTGHYDQYIRVTVTISDAAAWVGALGANFNTGDLFIGFDETMWVHGWNNMIGATTIPQDLVFVMYYKDVLTAGSDITLFTDVQIPTSLTKEQAAEFDGGFSINIKAEAVQAENIVPAGTSAYDAPKKAFDIAFN